MTLLRWAVTGIVAGSLVSSRAADWPMWRYDAARSAAAPEALPTNLTLLWSRKLPPVRQAWPLEPNQRLSFDASYEPVVLGKLVYVASPNDGSVTAYDTESGEERWRYFTEGPVRCAPACWSNRVYVGSDDGWLYCLEAGTGRELWKVRGAPSDRPDRRQIGNGHLVSFWPVRGGPVVVDGVVYFAAGIWPIFGVFVHALDAETGRVKWTNGDLNFLMVRVWRLDFDQEAGLSPQGHLVVAGDRLIVPNGRSLPAALDRTTGKLVYYSQARRNGDSRVATHGDYVFYGRAGVMRRGDFQEVAHEVYDEVEHHGAPYIKVAAACDYAAAFADAVAYGVANGVFYAYDIAKPELLSAGADPMGGTLSGKATIKPLLWRPPTLWQLDTGRKGVASVAIKAGSRVFGSAGRKVLAVETAGDSVRLAWEAEVEGTPSALVAADGKLFVALAEGGLCCFGERQTVLAEPSRQEPTETAKESSESPADAAWARQAADILQATGVKSGYALVLGLTDGRLVEALLHQTDLFVWGVDADTAKVERLRRRWTAAGLYGERVMVLNGEPFGVLFPPYLASLIVSETPDAAALAARADAAQVFNILRPYGGVLCLDWPAERQPAFEEWARGAGPQAVFRHENGRALLMRPGPLPGSAPWTHEEGDAGRTHCSRDTLVQAPLGILWYGDHNRFAQRNDYWLGVKPRVVGGRVFALQQHSDRVVLFAYDAYTGRFLWKQEVKCRRAHARFAALDDGVYLAADGRCVVFDPATGQPRREQVFNPRATTLVKDIRVDDGVIVVASDEVPDAEMEGVYFQAIGYSGQGYFNSTQLVALDRYTGAELWRRQARDCFNNAGLAMGTGLVFVVDSLPMRSFGRWKARVAGLTECPAVLYALEARTGQVRWAVTNVARYVEGGGDAWVAYSPDTGLLLSGRHGTTRAYEGSTGRLRWEQGNLYGAGLLILRSKTMVDQAGLEYDLLTGKPLGGQRIQRPYWGGCNSMVGTEALVFRRLGSAYYRDTQTQQEFHLRNIRSGCTISLIAADGLLNAPNYSLYCVCNYAIQTSLAMMHMPEVAAWDQHEPYPVPPPPPTQTRGKVLKIGPFPCALVDLAGVARDIRAGRIGTQPWRLRNDMQLEWNTNGPQSAWYDVVLAKVPQDAEPSAYVLQTDVVSDRPQKVDMRLHAPTNVTDLVVFLNGERLGTITNVLLQAGANRLLVHYAHAFTAFIEFVKAGTVERAQGLRLEWPPVPEAAVEPYEPPASGMIRSLPLSGTWRAKLIRPIPEGSASGPPPDTGVSDEARRLIAPTADDGAWQAVSVPAKWESYGGAWATADGEAVFRRTVNIPQEWAGRPLKLSLGAIDDFDDTFWNGVPVGRTDIQTPNFWSVPRLYAIPGALVQPGPAVIAVRVFDHGGSGGLVGRPEELFVVLSD